MSKKISKSDYITSIVDEIKSWGINNLKIYRNIPVGYRFVDKTRTIDIVIELNNKTVGIRTMIQSTSGTVYEKVAHILEDAEITPIPLLIIFASKNNAIKDDIKARLIASGKGLEMKFNNNEFTEEAKNMLKQRVYIELGLNWLEDYQDKEV